MSALATLPVHGFVLAGGASTRMGTDKALLRLGSAPMLEAALRRLRLFCEPVSLVGNRQDLLPWAPVVKEQRLHFGPLAGIEAGLASSCHPWTLFTPVDVPFVPASLLRSWAKQVLHRADVEEVCLSYLAVHGLRQPAFCMLHQTCLRALTALADSGEHRPGLAFERVAASMGGHAALWVAEAAELALDPASDGPAVLAGPGAPDAQRPLPRRANADELALWFSNLNTPADLRRAEAVHREGTALA